MSIIMIFKALWHLHLWKLQRLALVKPSEATLKELRWDLQCYFLQKKCVLCICAQPIGCLQLIATPSSQSKPWDGLVTHLWQSLVTDLWVVKIAIQRVGAFGISHFTGISLMGIEVAPDVGSGRISVIREG